MKINNIGYVCTTGKSLNNKVIVEKLYKLGLTTVRFNMSYRDKCMIGELVPAINEINLDKDIKIKTMVDLRGPEIRIDIKEPMLIEKNNIYVIGKDILIKEGNISVLDVGDIIIFGDGEIQFKIIEKIDNYLKCISLNNGMLKKNKKITNEKLCKTISFLSDLDKEDIKTALRLGIDYLCISFVNSLEDVNEVKRIVGNHKIKIIAKIETKEGVENLEKIISKVDGIMIGRGDLGVRYPIYNLASVQKKICNIVKKYNKKIIIGTGFLSSMKKEEIPTRAEVCDIYNAVLDGADEIMFSGETATSISPENVLLTANRIIESIEM